MEVARESAATSRANSNVLFRLVAVVLLLNLFVASLAALSLGQSKRQYLERAAQDSKNLSEALGYSITGLVDTIDVALLAAVDEAEREIAAGGIKPSDFSRHLSRLQERLPEVVALRMANARGDLIYGAGVPDGHFTLADRPFFQQLRDDPRAELVISSPVMGRVTPKLIIAFARRINNPDGSFAGVISCPVAVDTIRTMLSAIDVGPTGGISLRDGNMRIMVRHQGTSGDTKVIGVSKISPELRLLLQEGRQRGTFYTPLSWDGVPKMVSFLKVGRYPLYVLVGLAEKDFLAPWRRDLFRMSCLVGVFVLVTVLLSRRIYYGWQSEVSAQEALRFSRDTLELRVAERTEELDRTNRRLSRELAERKTIEEARDKALVLLETLLASSPTGIQVFDGATGDCVVANETLAAMVGGTRSRLLSQNFRILGSWKSSGVDAIAEEVLVTGVTRHLERPFVTTFGRSVYFDFFISRCEVDGCPHIMMVVVDVTEHKQLQLEKQRMEEQMRHVQKLESLGVLAGGIAHDFNNILMVVTGNADLALMRLPEDSPARDNIAQIEVAAGRAAELARQMLAYSGKGKFLIEELDLSHLVKEMGQMLEVSISKKTALKYDFQQPLPAISGDASQLRQVVLNLVMNASEAIGEKAGVITLATGSIDCDREMLSDSWIDDSLPEGRYVVLEVSDTGCGIEPGNIQKIFDPFFTTKFTGRGLGMAAVLGIVRGHRGAIKVESEVGKGTTFRVLLPALALPAQRPVTQPGDGLFSGEGTVLLVDDEENIRKLGGHMLSAMGFEVLVARDGREALEVYGRHGQEIVCVLLDLTMPEMDGEQTLKELRLIDTSVPVIVASGYSEYEVAEKFSEEGVAFIQKPYRLMEMSNKLREVLS
ncbi:ATP-binding protein [Geomonas sp. Red32]|uniref:hybrid sensor histidine kinase/response regulator n=1 Tax=Geomonas sp. Red32 TaxID=2912856 RepID=UPI00202CDD63|nr:ATP-binding protein [Geomonas sp. Red32]MCM0083627.1 ATP-binding protein [Geomonas sp. Red32]